MVSLLRGGFSMRRHLTIIRAVLVALFVFVSTSVLADDYPAVEKWMNPVSGAWLSTFDEACQAFLNNNLTYYNSWSRQNDTTCHLYSTQNQFTYNQVLNRSYSCPSGGTLNNATHICENASACPAGESRNTVTGACEPPPPPECDSSLNEIYRADLGGCGCTVGQYKPLGAEIQRCETPQCPSGYYVNLTVADGFYDCTVEPPDCPLPVPMCSTPSYQCMGEASTPTTIPSCDNTCPAGQHASGGSCVPDDESPVQCPPNYSYNVALASCESSPPIVCQEGYKAGKVNGESVCVASSTGTPNQTPTKNTATTTTTSVTTTTIYDSNGNETGTSVSTTTGTSSTTIDTTGLAQDSTVKAVLDTLTGTSDRSGDAYQGGGSGSAPSSNGQALATKKTELQAMINGIKTEFSALKPMMASGGSITCDGGVDLSFVNAHFEICLEPYTEQLSRIGYGVYLVAAAFAVMIILG
jgi:hypothetical protein